jgi:flotillin
MNEGMSVEVLGIWIAVIAGVIAIGILFVKANLYVCPPNEVLIFSGRKRRLPDGTVVGFRLVKGGRGLRMPIIESVHRMSLVNIPIEMEIKGALSAGIIPLNVQAMANIKIAGTEQAGLSNAVERFLGRSNEHISQVTREVLEGSIRGVLATLSPEEANTKRIEFAQRISDEAREDLKKLGLTLDTMKILNISDEQGYLESVGRRKNAEVRRDAKIAEAEAEADARRVSAEAKRRGSVAEAEADMVIVDADNKLRVKRAELAGQANQSEERAKVAGQIARAEEEQKLETQRVQLNRAKYEADVVVPARAEKEALQLKAAGQAANIMEDGKARAESIRLMREQWEKGDTRELFLIQQLPTIIETITKVIADNLSIERLTIVDGGSGQGVPTLVKGLTGSVVSVMEQIKNATGLDIPDLLQRRREG